MTGHPEPCRRIIFTLEFAINHKGQLGRLSTHRKAKYPRASSSKSTASQHDCPSVHCLKVGGTLGDLAGLEGNVLDDDLLVVDAGNTDPGGVGGQISLEDIHVGVLEGGAAPCLAAVAAHVNSLSAVGSVLDGSGEPVLGGSTVHVDLERSGSRERACNPLPLDAIDTAAGHTVGQFRPGSRGHVKMARIPARLVCHLVRLIRYNNILSSFFILPLS